MAKLLLFGGEIPHRRIYDTATADAFVRAADSGKIDGIIWGGAAFENDPGVIDSELTEMMRATGLLQYWFRRRFDERREYEWPTAGNGGNAGLFDIQGWRDFFEVVNAEAGQLDCEPAMDGEPYGETAFSYRMRRKGPWRETGGLNDADAQRLIHAITVATAGRHRTVSMMWPSGSNSQRHFAWAMMHGLGELPVMVNYKTRKMTSLSDRIVMNPPDYIDTRLDVLYIDISGPDFNATTVDEFVEGIWKPLQNDGWPMRDFKGPHDGTDPNRIVLPEPAAVVPYAHPHATAEYPNGVRSAKTDELIAALA